VIYVASYPESGYTRLNVTGVDSAYGAFSYLFGKTVAFQ